MAAIITRTGKGAAITQSENDSNLDSLCGINEPQTGTAYTVNAADQNSTIEFSNAAPVMATLTLISTIIAANDTSDFQVSLKNIGVGVVTITPTTDTFDDGSAIKVLAQYEWITIQTDSTQSLWNIIASSNASKVDGLDASQFFRSDADDTTTGNVTISKATPLITINATSGNGVIQHLDSTATLRFFQRLNTSTDNYELTKFDTDGSTAVAQLFLTNTGKVNVTTGLLQLAGTDVTSDATELSLLENATSTDITSSGLLAGVINAVYPVGSIYISTVATNPGILLGVGTWIASGVGSILVGVGTSDEVYALDDTGGASTESSHLHSVSITSSVPSVTQSFQDVAPNVPWPSPTFNHTHSVSGSTASNSPATGDNMPPYLVVQMWERTI